MGLAGLGWALQFSMQNMQTRKWISTSYQKCEKISTEKKLEYHRIFEKYVKYQMKIAKVFNENIKRRNRILEMDWYISTNICGPCDLIFSMSAVTNVIIYWTGIEISLSLPP